MKKNQTVAKVLIRRVGIVKAARVLGFLVMYGTVCAERGRRLSMEEFAEAGMYSVSSSYRLLRMYRDAIPEFDHPYDLMVAVMEHRAGEFSGLGAMWGTA